MLTASPPGVPAATSETPLGRAADYLHAGPASKAQQDGVSMFTEREQALAGSFTQVGHGRCSPAA